MLDTRTGLKMALSLLFAMFLLGGITACDKHEKLSDKAHEMVDKAGDKLDEAGEAMEDMTDKVKKKAKEAKDSMTDH